MSRRVYLLGLGLALVALGLAFIDWALGSRPGATEANCQRVHKGMTMIEVEAIFGGPGQWHSGKGSIADSWDTYEWKGSAGTALITFHSKCVYRRRLLEGLEGTEGEHVVEVAFQRTTQPLLTRLRAWLGW
jgi:hypothetical protein